MKRAAAFSLALFVCVIGCTLVQPHSVNTEADQSTPTPSVQHFLPFVCSGPPPVRGSVLIEGGACCVGGIVGQTIDISTAFSATSRYADVTQMRVLAYYPGCSCPTEEDMTQADWEPFVQEKTFNYTIVYCNWVCFGVGAQYRDERGNVSSVYCDNISVEGMPPPPTSELPRKIRPITTRQDRSATGGLSLNARLAHSRLDRPVRAGAEVTRYCAGQT
jgi:hypothetical protein